MAYQRDFLISAELFLSYYSIYFSHVMVTVAIIGRPTLHTGYTKWTKSVYLLSKCGKGD